MVNAGVEHAHLDLNFTCSDCYLNSQLGAFLMRTPATIPLALGSVRQRQDVSHGCA